MIHIIKIGLKNSWTLTKKFFVQNYTKNSVEIKKNCENKIVSINIMIYVILFIINKKKN